MSIEWMDWIKKGGEETGKASEETMLQEIAQAIKNSIDKAKSTLEWQERGAEKTRKDIAGLEMYLEFLEEVKLTAKGDS